MIANIAPVWPLLVIAVALIVGGFALIWAAAVPAPAPGPVLEPVRARPARRPRYEGYHRGGVPHSCPRCRLAMEI